MAIIKINKSDRFITMSIDHLRDNNLSLKAKGLLSLMLSFQNGSEYSIENFSKFCKDGITAVKSSLNELKENGYVQIEKRNDKETGKFEYVYNVSYESIRKLPKVVFPPMDNPPLVNPSMETPFMDDTYNIFNINKENIKNKEVYNKCMNNNIKELKDKELNNIKYINKINSIKKIEYIKEKENIIKEKEKKVSINQEILDYFNSKTERRLKLTTQTNNKINARLKEGYTLEDFKTVIDVCYDLWKGTEYEKYIHPITLFNSEFEKRLNWNIPKKKNEKEIKSYWFDD